MSDLEDLIQQSASSSCPDDTEIGVEAADVLGSPTAGSNDENEEEKEAAPAKRQTTLASSSTSVSRSNSQTTFDGHGGECAALLVEPTPSSPSTVLLISK